jgi:hypothetical protein
MMPKAVVLLLFALGGAPGGEGLTSSPSALVETPPPLRAELALGAWQGALVDGGGIRRPIEASFVDGLRANTVFGYFTLPAPGRPDLKVRRLGRVVGNDLVFDLRDGGRVALRLVSGRLVGEVNDPAGHLLSGHSAIELGRFRP